MQFRRLLICGTAIAVMMAAAPASADTLRSPVAFNNGIGQKTTSQPADGVEVSYQITMQGGDLDGCTSTSSSNCGGATRVPGACSTSPAR